LAANKCLSDVVYLFVNDKNVALAAAEVTKLTDKSIVVIPTQNVVAGIGGLFAFRATPDGSGPPDLAAILAAAERVRAAQVFFAGKDATVGATSVVRGKPAAIVAGELIAGESLAETVRAALVAMGVERGGLVTLYYGGQQKERDAQRLAEELQAAFPAADVEYYYGGMKNAEYWLSFDE
jgi:dihydroxyacetone kinase-like predicted kinase